MHRQTMAYWGVAFFSAGVLLLGSWTPIPPEASADETAKPAPAAKKPSHKVVRITGSDAQRPAEVAVAVSPENPDQLIAISHQSGGPWQMPASYAYVSGDGGATWKATRLPEMPQRHQGDDAATFGLDRTAYRAFLSFNGIRQRRPQHASTGVFVSSSRDGATWSQPVAVVDHVNSVEPFEDKPWIVVDTLPDSPHRGNVYVSWTRFDVYGSKDPAHQSHIYFSRSKDAGRTFAPANRISDSPGDCQDSSQTLMGAVPAVGPGGEVYVVWAGPEGIVFDKSTDGGWTFGKDKVLTKTPGGWDIPAEGLTRHNGCPVLGSDLSTGPNRGSLYVNWIDKRNGDADVFVMSSRDKGETWSEPVRVNDDPKGNGKDQLFTWMAVDPRDGSINVVFYDRRDLADTMTGVTMARSVDGGRTFVNYRVDQEPFACYRGVFFGDYIGIAANHGQVVAVYSHFVNRWQLALSAAVFRFKPGTQEPVEEPEKKEPRGGTP
jgi:hypothetical protein